MLKKILFILGVATACAATHFYDKNISVSISCVFAFIFLIFIDNALSKRIRKKEIDDIECYLKKCFDKYKK